MSVADRSDHAITDTDIDLEILSLEKKFRDIIAERDQALREKNEWRDEEKRLIQTLEELEEEAQVKAKVVLSEMEKEKEALTEVVEAKRKNNRQLCAGMMSSKDKRLLELQNKISKCQEEIMHIKHEKELLLKRCESIKEGKESSVHIEFRRSLRLTEISWSEGTLEQLREALRLAELEESNSKKAISEMQEKVVESRKVKEKLLEERTAAVQEKKRQVVAEHEILVSLGISG